MQKLTNFAGQTRHMAFGGMGNRHMDNSNPPHQQRLQTNRSLAPPNGPANPQEPSNVTLAFNVPFSFTLAGPHPDDILHGSPGAAQRWTHPAAGISPSTPPVHKLPVHVENLEQLRKFCKGLGEKSGGRVEATVTSTEHKANQVSQRLPKKGQITNVAITGDGDTVHKMRARILNETPIALKCATVHIEERYVYDAAGTTIRDNVIEHTDKIAHYTGTDIFLLRPRGADPDNISANYANGTDQSLEQRLIIAIYGDMESSEHAKMRVLLMIDQIVRCTPWHFVHC